MTKSKGFSGAELSIATQAFTRGELERKSLLLRKWESDGASDCSRPRRLARLAGEIEALRQVLGFMIQNRK